MSNFCACFDYYFHRMTVFMPCLTYAIFLQVHCCLQLSSEITDDLHEQAVTEFIRETANLVLSEELNKKR